MDYLRNHCWCHESNWDDSDYSCTVIVSMNSYEENYKEDWDNLIVVDENYTCNLRPEVLQWLEVNVIDTKVPYGNNSTTRAWCIGSCDYRKTSCTGLSVFFQRRKDAMAFIKTWSKWKRPLFYRQYFTDVVKNLDVNTGKYLTK